jgi:hypothetical protein
MECKYVSELIPWYLNETLEAGDRLRVQEHLSGCPSCQQEVHETVLVWSIHHQHVPTEALIGFAFDQWEQAPDPEPIERHLAVCRDCAEQFELALQSRCRMADEADPAELLVSAEPAGHQWHWLRSFSQARFPYAVAASLLIANLSLGAWLVSSHRGNQRVIAELKGQVSERNRNMARAQEQLQASNEQLEARARQSEQDRMVIAKLEQSLSERSEPVLGVPSETLDVPSTKRGGEAATDDDDIIRVPRGVNQVTLEVELPDELPSPDYVVEIRTRRGERLWQRQGRLEDAMIEYLTIHVGRRFLPSGAYRVNLYSREKGRWKLMGEYPLRIQFQ